MFLLDSLLIGGIRFCLEKVAQVADEQLASPEALQRQLLEAQMQLDEGAIDEAAFARLEADIFARLRALRGDQGTGGIADSTAFDEVDVQIADDDFDR